MSPINPPAFVFGDSGAVDSMAYIYDMTDKVGCKKLKLLKSVSIFLPNWFLWFMSVLITVSLLLIS